MGSLERRLAALEARLGGTRDINSLEKERIAREALSLLSTPELKLVISGLERAGEVWREYPPDTPLPAEVWEELLTEDELVALEHLGELEDELREKSAS
jgi:hypothetical protein